MANSVEDIRIAARNLLAFMDVMIPTQGDLEELGRRITTKYGR